MVVPLEAKKMEHCHGFHASVASMSPSNWISLTRYESPFSCPADFQGNFHHCLNSGLKLTSAREESPSKSSGEWNRSATR